MTLVAIYLSSLMIRAGGSASEDDGTTAGRIKFLGMLSLASNGFNLVLILLEGAYVYIVSVHHA